MLEIEALCRQFNRRRVLHEVSLCLRAAACVAIVGKSGEAAQVALGVQAARRWASSRGPIATTCGSPPNCPVRDNRRLAGLPVGWVLRDSIIPPDLGRRLFASLGEAKRLWVVPAADHNDWLGRVLPVKPPVEFLVRASQIRPETPMPCGMSTPATNCSPAIDHLFCERPLPICTNAYSATQSGN